MSAFDKAMNLAADNDSGAAICHLAPRVQLLISDRGDCFTIWDFRPNAKRPEKVVTAQWAHKFLSQVRFAVNVTSVAI